MLLQRMSCLSIEFITPLVSLNRNLKSSAALESPIVIGSINTPSAIFVSLFRFNVSITRAITNIVFNGTNINININVFFNDR